MTLSNPEHATAPVSVIVPSYNCGRCIAAAIDSILAQTLQPEQIVIVDDGSTDNTEQVVRQYADPRLQYIKQENSGAATARNTGLNAARGEYVTFLNADRIACRDQLIKAHIDVALYQTTLGRIGPGWRSYRDSFGIPGSPLRKFKGSMRMAVALGSRLFQ